MLLDFQVDAARRHQEHLADTARQFLASPRSAILLMLREKDGRLRTMGTLHDGMPGGQK